MVACVVHAEVLGHKHNTLTLIDNPSQLDDSTFMYTQSRSMAAVSPAPSTRSMSSSSSTPTNSQQVRVSMASGTWYGKQCGRHGKWLQDGLYLSFKFISMHPL